MSKYEKLIAKLLNRNSTIAYQEIKYLVGKMGYVESQKGKTLGSRVAFINEGSKHIIRLHKPHLGNELKSYVKKELVSDLKEQKLL